MIITITGDIGAGKSTVAKILTKKLNFEYRYTGNYMREMAAKKGISLAELGELAKKSEEIDEEIDAWQTKIGEEEDNIILDARIGFHFVPQSTKVFLTCNERIAAERTFNDDNLTRKIEKRSKNIKEEIIKNKLRKECEKERYLKYYNLDYFDVNNYDIILNTSNLSPEEVVSKIIEKLDI